MNTPIRDDDELRCAEYVLGVLDASERRALEQAVYADPSLQRTLAQWQDRLACLVEDVTPVEPTPRVWQRIQRDLNFHVIAPVAPASQISWWNNLRLWRWVGLAASAIALSMVVVNINSLLRSQPPQHVAPDGYLIAAIARQDGVTQWTATVDKRRGTMVIVPTEKAAVIEGHATELWLIPRDAKPIPLGVFDATRSASMTLPAEIVARIDKNAVLAVSSEPPGGSPTGSPSGPILATGHVVDA